MSRLTILIALLLLLVIGGGITSLLIAQSGQVLPVLTQVGSPDANPTVITDWKANQFFLMIGFILFNLIGIGLTLAVIFWLMDRGVRTSKAEAQQRQTEG